MRAESAKMAAAVIALLFFLQVFWGSRELSLTWDEPSFITAGYSYLLTRQFVLNPSHPPLMQELEALPLLVMGLPFPQGNGTATLFERPVTAVGYDFVFRSGNDPRLIAFWSRLPVMLLGSGLILTIYLWGRKLYGEAPALFGAAVAAFCPNLIAHAKLATEDLGCTALFFAAVATFWYCFQRRSYRAYLFCGMVTGMALLAKYTSLLLIPIYIIIAAAKWWRNRRDNSFPHLMRMGTAIGGIALLVVALGYDGAPSLYWHGLWKVYSDIDTNQSWYLLGNIHDSARWYYYLIVLVLKSPVPYLLLIVAAAVAAWRDREHREATLFLLVPTVAVLGVSCFDACNYGIRRILPALPFLYLLTGQLIVQNRRPILVGSLLLLVWGIFESGRIYPHHLSYLNSLAGGPLRGPFLLDDSNIDWGQDLPALAQWQHRHPEAQPLKLFYFGSADPRAYGVQAQDFLINFEELEKPVPGYYAISATNVVLFDKLARGSGRNLGWLRRFTPVDRAGYSILIYRFPEAGKSLPALAKGAAYEN